MSNITINGNTVNPEALPDGVPESAEKTNFILVQGHNDFSAAQKLALEKLEVEIQEYVARYTYLCRYKPADLERIRKQPYVKNVTM
jgi:serine protease AprX